LPSRDFPWHAGVLAMKYPKNDCLFEVALYFVFIFVFDFNQWEKSVCIEG